MGILIQFWQLNWFVNTNNNGSGSSGQTDYNRIPCLPCKAQFRRTNSPSVPKCSYTISFASSDVSLIMGQQFSWTCIRISEKNIRVSVRRTHASTCISMRFTINNINTATNALELYPQRPLQWNHCTTICQNTIKKSPCLLNNPVLDNHQIEHPHQNFKISPQPMLNHPEDKAVAAC